MASFGIVTFYPADDEPVEGTEYWCPMLAFHELAARFGDARPRPLPEISRPMHQISKTDDSALRMAVTGVTD